MNTLDAGGRSTLSGDLTKQAYGFSSGFLMESIQLASQIDPSQIDAVAGILALTHSSGGRVFFAGSGGGAGHSSHAAADFRKMCGFECYSVTDNVSELTARVNDESWESSYSSWLLGSRLSSTDCLFVFSVGGGDQERGVSANLVGAIDAALSVGAGVVGIVGRDGGYLAQKADAHVLVPTVNPDHVTAHVEGFQALIWHLLVMHPSLCLHKPKWEGLSESFDE